MRLRAVFFSDQIFNREFSLSLKEGISGFFLTKRITNVIRFSTCVHFLLHLRNVIFSKSCGVNIFFYEDVEWILLGFWLKKKKPDDLYISCICESWKINRKALLRSNYNDFSYIFFLMDDLTTMPKLIDLINYYYPI